MFSYLCSHSASSSISTLSLHDALPILILALPHPLVEGAFLSRGPLENPDRLQEYEYGLNRFEQMGHIRSQRSEEHTSELQSLRHLVCRLLLEKKNKPICSTSEKFDETF